MPRMPEHEHEVDAFLFNEHTSRDLADDPCARVDGQILPAGVMLDLESHHNTWPSPNERVRPFVIDSLGPRGNGQRRYEKPSSGLGQQPAPRGVKARDWR